MEKELYQIGDVAKITGVTLRTLRYYEEIGLIEPDERSDGNFRLYASTIVTRIKLINNLKRLDFSLSDIKNLFNHCTQDVFYQTKDILLSQRKKIEEKLLELKSLENEINDSLTIIDECLSCERKDICKDITCENQQYLIQSPLEYT